MFLFTGYLFDSFHQCDGFPSARWSIHNVRYFTRTKYNTLYSEWLLNVWANVLIVTFQFLISSAFFRNIRSNRKQYLSVVSYFLFFWETNIKIRLLSRFQEIRHFFNGFKSRLEQYIMTHCKITKLILLIRTSGWANFKQLTALCCNLSGKRL